MNNTKQDIVNELHRSARRTFPRRTVVILGINDLCQADLVEMIPYARVNKGYKYILVLINTFSKYVYCEPVKTKSGKEVTKATENILKRMKHRPKNLQTDMGREFYNKDFKDLIQKWNINHYSTHSVLKASIVERVNRTLKSKMWKQFSLQGSYKWLDILPKIVKDYNNTKHRKTGMKPAEITKKNEEYLLKNVYNKIKMVDPKKPKFKLGDFVRISKYKTQFSKSYTPNWSNEIFSISKVNNTNPRTYLLQDAENKEILGSVYEEELTPVKWPNIFLIEKILKRRGNQILVKWLGMNEKSWINEKNIL